MWALLALRGVPGLLRHILSQSVSQQRSFLYSTRVGFSDRMNVRESYSPAIEQGTLGRTSPPPHWNLEFISFTCATIFRAGKCSCGRYEDAAAALRTLEDAAAVLKTVRVLEAAPISLVQ